MYRTCEWRCWFSPWMFSIHWSLVSKMNRLSLSSWRNSVVEMQTSIWRWWGSRLLLWTILIISPCSCTISTACWTVYRHEITHRPSANPQRDWKEHTVAELRYKTHDTHTHTHTGYFDSIKSSWSCFLSSKILFVSFYYALHSTGSHPTVHTRYTNP